MALYNIHIPSEQKEFVCSVFKFSFILIVFHILMTLTYPGKACNMGMSGDLFNPDFIHVFVYLLIALSAYYLVGEELVNFV